MTNRDLLDVVRNLAREFEVFGELGRKSDTDVWFLARKAGDEALVALRLVARGADQWGDPRYEVEMAREVGAAVAAGGQTACDACGATLRTFARFCGHCGADQATGPKGGAPSLAERRLLLAEVREAASDIYDVLGEMPWAGGDGVVYFALNRSNSELVRLRLRQADTGMELGETRVGASSPNALSVTRMSPVADRPSVPVSAPAPSPLGVTAPSFTEPVPVAAPPIVAPAPARRSAPDLSGKVRILTVAVAVLSVIVLIETFLLLLR